MNTNHWNRVLSVFIGLLLTVAGKATMVNLSIADGLAGETVNRVMTDRGGHVWIATDNGLNLYNGKKLTIFPFPHGNTSVAVNDLCETSDGDIYAATDAGLYRLRRGSKGFEPLLPEVERPISLLAVGDTIYIGGKQGFMMYDGRQLRHQDMGVSRKGYDNIVHHYEKGSDGLVWFSSRYAINSYDPKTGQIKNHSLENILPHEASVVTFALWENRIFLGTFNKGLYVVDASEPQKAIKVSGVGELVRSVCLSADGQNVCVATNGTGAFLIDPQSLQIVGRFGMEQQGRWKTPTNTVYSYCRDANGCDWIGFVRYGLSHSLHQGTLFRPYSLGGFSTQDMNVRSFCVRSGECVIGTQNGFWYADSVRGIQRYFQPEEYGYGHIVNKIVWWQGAYYIGTYDAGLRVFDPQTLTLRRQTLNARLDDAFMGDIKTAPDGSLWIGCSEGLFIINPQGEVRHFTEQNSHIVGGDILSITFDSRGNAWLAGISGVSLYSAASNDIVEAAFPQDFWNRETSLFGVLGRDSLIYMRNGPQVFYTTSDMSRYGELPLPITLRDKWSRSMADIGGVLWLASERGLLRLDSDGHLQQFGDGEGVPGSQISEVTVTGDTLWAATSQGLFTMPLSLLEPWMQEHSHQVELYDIRLGSDLLSEADELAANENRRIRLSWNFTSEVLQACAVMLDYAEQRGRLYEYRVDGGSWQRIQDDEPMAVRRLFIGRHSLEVRLAGMEGSTSAYVLSVVPSIAAIVEFLLLVAALVFLWLWWRYRKNTNILLTERNEIEEALITAEQELREGMEMASESADAAEPSQQKYQKVRLDEAECEETVRRMREYLQRERVFTNPELKRGDLAGELGVSPAKLSQIFSHYLKENYYEFVNRYRLEEFKRLIDAGEYKRYTITALSERSGFKKTSFFSTFRKVEGMTPAEYLKLHHIEAKF